MNVVVSYHTLSFTIGMDSSAETAGLVPRGGCDVLVGWVHCRLAGSGTPTR